MNSYRPLSRAGHRFRTFHISVDELCLQLVGDFPTAVHHCKALAQQSDLLHLQGADFPRPPQTTTYAWFAAQVQVPEEMPGHRIWKTRGVKPCSGVPHASGISVSVSEAHAHSLSWPGYLPGCL